MTSMPTETRKEKVTELSVVRGPWSVAFATDD